MCFNIIFFFPQRTFVHTYGLGRLFLKVVEFLRMKGRRKTATRQILKLSRHAIAMKKKKGGRKNGI